jgi:hypothetical protein
MPAVEAMLENPPEDMRNALAQWADQNGVITG